MATSEAQYCNFELYETNKPGRLPIFQLQNGGRYKFMTLLSQEAPFAPPAVCAVAQYRAIAARSGGLAISLLFSGGDKPNLGLLSFNSLWMPDPEDALTFEAPDFTATSLEGYFLPWEQEEAAAAAQLGGDPTGTIGNQSLQKQDGMTWEIN